MKGRPCFGGSVGSPGVFHSCFVSPLSVWGACHRACTYQGCLRFPLVGRRIPVLGSQLRRLLPQPISFCLQQGKGRPQEGVSFLRSEEHLGLWLFSLCQSPAASFSLLHEGPWRVGGWGHWSGPSTAGVQLGREGAPSRCAGCMLVYLGADLLCVSNCPLWGAGLRAHESLPSRACGSTALSRSGPHPRPLLHDLVHMYRGLSCMCLFCVHTGVL